MNYKYKTMDEIALMHTEDALMSALELMDMDFEETESKEELVSKLVQAQKEHLHEIFYMASYEDLQALEIMSKNEASFVKSDTLGMFKGLYPDSLLELPGELCLITPVDMVEYDEYLEIYTSQEFLELFKEYLTDNQKQLAFALDEMSRIIRGCLYYYGAIEMEQLYELVSSKYKELNENLFKTVLGYKYTLNYAYNSEMLGNKEYIKDVQFDAFNNLQEVKGWKSKVREYKNISREELFEAGDDFFIENQDSFEALSQYFKPAFQPTEIDYEDFGDASKDGMFDFIMQNTTELLQRTVIHGEIVADFLEYFEFNTLEETQEGLTRLTNHANNLSRWDNRGYSVNEMMNRVDEVNNVVPIKAYWKKS